MEAIIIDNNKVIIDGAEIPPCPSENNPLSKYSRSTTIINRKIYKNGYEWTGAKWKKSLPALWHKYF